MVLHPLRGSQLSDMVVVSPTCDFVLSALDWVDRNLSHFDPSLEEAQPTHLQLQALAELALVTLLWGRIKPDLPLPTIDKAKSFLGTLVEDSRFWHRAVRFPEEFVPICDLIAATRGQDTSPQLQALQQVISSGVLDSIDRTLVSRMELRLTVEWAGLTWYGPELDEISSHCPRPPLPMFASDDDCYTLTHLIIFVTEFGRRPFPLNGGLRNRNYLARILSSYIVRYIHQRNLDLLIELLLSWKYLRLPYTTLIHQAWRFFVSHQSPDGAFQKLITDSQASSKVSSESDPERAWFYQCYHTTLLAIMAGATSDIPSTPLSKENSALDDSPINEPSPESFDETIELGRGSVEKAWQWVSKDAEAFDGNVGLEAVGYSLLAWWIWRAVAGTAKIQPPDTLLFQCRAFHLNHYFYAGRGSLTLNIITAGIIRQFDKENADAGAFLERISDVVANDHPKDTHEELALCEKRVILNALGFEHHPYVSDYIEVIAAAEQCALRADQDRIGALLTRIESLAGYGANYVDIEPGGIWLKDLLQGLADDSLRKYDWPRACRCVRALGYLNLISHETARDYMAFFALHQLPDGAFGYLGPDSQALLSALDDHRSLDEINLSITAEALWTIAELTIGDRWRLFDSLRSKNLEDSN